MRTRGFSYTVFDLQDLELAMKGNILRSEKCLEVITEQEKQMRKLSSCHTIEELFIHQKSIYPGLAYQRIPLSECCAPKEEASQNTIPACGKSIIFVEWCRSSKRYSIGCWRPWKAVWLMTPAVLLSSTVLMGKTELPLPWSLPRSPCGTLMWVIFSRWLFEFEWKNPPMWHWWLEKRCLKWAHMSFIYSWPDPVSAGLSRVWRRRDCQCPRCQVHQRRISGILWRS